MKKYLLIPIFFLALQQAGASNIFEYVPKLKFKSTNLQDTTRNIPIKREDCVKFLNNNSNNYFFAHGQYTKDNNLILFYSGNYNDDEWGAEDDYLIILDQANNIIKKEEIGHVDYNPGASSFIVPFFMNDSTFYTLTFTDLETDPNCTADCEPRTELTIVKNKIGRNANIEKQKGKTIILDTPSYKYKDQENLIYMSLTKYMY